MGSHIAPADHLTLHLQICPLNGNFADSCSDSSYFIPTLRAHHLADQALTGLPPSNGDFTDSSLTIHISFLLWELIIWQTRSWQIYLPDPHQMAILQIPALLWQLIFHSYSHISFLLWELNIWQTRSWQIYPLIKWQFHRFLLNWQLIFHSYSESSSFGRPGPDRSTPHPMVILQIPALTAHYSESLSFGRPGLGRSTPLINGNFTDSCSTLKAHIWQTKCWLINPHIKWQFHRFLWNSYFIPTLRAQHLADQVFADLPPIQQQFHRFLLWQLSTLRTHHLADQVLTDLPPHQMAISQIPALTAPYSKSSTFGRPGLGRSDPPHQMAISQIPLKFIFHSYSESSTFGWPGLGRSTLPPIKWQFHRFLLYSESSYLLDQVLADQPPPTNGNFTDVGRSTSPSNSNGTDSCSALRAHI